jgi:hypothetical protein
MSPVQIDARSLSTESSGAAHAAERGALMIDDDRSILLDDFTTALVERRGVAL